MSYRNKTQGKLVIGALILICVVIAALWKVVSKRNESMVIANAQQIQNILSEDVEQILDQIPIEQIELSLPTDGKGVRVLVRVEKNFAEQVPSQVTVTHRKRSIVVPLEADESYVPYTAQ